jgi:hypothetical protein
MRYVFALLCTLFLWASPAFAQFSVGIGIGMPNVRIGINVPAYPNLVPIPGYPVYYVPGMPANYFFYDGMYWAYDNDTWYSSTWYNGPWGVVAPEAVPLFILRVPVRYYARPPLYFRGWAGGGPPHWGEHWGGGWEQGHAGWDHWDHRAAYARAPLPSYQRQYSGGRYPGAEQQQAMHNQNYHYQPHEAVVQQHFQAQSAPHPQGQPPRAMEAQRPGGAPAPGGPPGGHAPGPQELHQAPHQESHPQGHEQKHEEEHR